LYRNFQTVSDPRPDQAKLLDLLVEFAAAYPEVLIFLDAFDECDPTLRGHVISIVQRLHEANIKIWVTTQPGRIQDFVKDGLKDAVKAEIKAKKLDVMSYVTAKLISHDIDDNLRTEIIDTISSGVDGMYDICNMLTNEQIFTCQSTTRYSPRSRISSIYEVTIRGFAEEPVRVLYERTTAYSSRQVARKGPRITCSILGLSCQKETKNGRTP
jgi:hypothetical protein